MGKLKRGRKNQKARHNPLTNKNQSTEAKKDESTRKNKILPLIEKLLSSSPNDRSMALGAITVLCEDDRMRKLLLKEKLVQIIMEQCLNDNNDEIIVESFGLLRNLGIDEGYDVLKYYWRSNIWISIQSSLDKILDSFRYLAQEEPKKQLSKKQKEDEKSKKQLLYDFTEHLLSLVVVIASGSDELYSNVFDKIDPILKLVIDLINLNISTNRLSDKLFNTLLDFIYEFSSESDDFVKKLSDADFPLQASQTFIESDAQESNKLGKAYMEGIKFHINEVMQISTNKHEISYGILSNLFNNLSHINLQELKDNLKPKDNAQEPIQTPVPQDIDQQISGTTKEMDAAKVDLQNLEITIDLTTSIFEFLAINENLRGPVDISPEVTELIFKTIVPSIIELIKFDQENGILSLTDKFIICLNNLAWLFLSLDSMPVEWFDTSIKLWELVINMPQSDDEVLQKDCLSFLWAVIKALGPAAKERIDPEMINQLLQKAEGFLSEAQNGDFNPDQLEYYLAIIGFTGATASIIDNTAITYQISEFLLKTIHGFVSNKLTCKDPTAIDLVLESINLIFEIFGDKSFPYDFDIYVKNDYNGKLKSMEPQVKDLYKKIDKNKYGDLKIKGEETWTNLSRFIQYKASEQ